MPSKTSRKKSSHIEEGQRTSTGVLQWFLEKDPKHPVYYHNNLEVFICGEEGYAKIAQDIKSAKHSLVYICWGFDPSMELTRRSGTWPRGELLGDLLKQAAQRGVAVKILYWYSVIGDMVQDNVVGNEFGPVPLQEKRQSKTQYAKSWFSLARSGRMTNLSIRARDADTSAVEASLEAAKKANNASPNGKVEGILLDSFATHHQKSIVIDYEYEEGSSSVGYVMGLNSLTDYWDTSQHRCNDLKRGELNEGHGKGEVFANLKPLRDYACRVRGDALEALYQNFVEGWNLAKSKPIPTMPRKEGYESDNVAAAAEGENLTMSTPAKLTSGLKKRHQAAQINRTQPEAQERNIDLSYRQAFESARHYIYIENQYFQHKELVQHLKGARDSYLKKCEQSGVRPESATLYVFIVTPSPEREGMIPATYDSADELGLGRGFPTHRRQKIGDAAYDAETAQIEQQNSELRRQEREAREAELEEASKRRDEETKAILEGREPPPEPGLTVEVDLSDQPAIKAIMCQLYCANPEKVVGKPYVREIYIHSKLMIVDDSFMTLGSANLNLRSMAADSEINIASDDPVLAHELRTKVWDNLAQGNADAPGERFREMGGDELYLTSLIFDKWSDRALNNRKSLKVGVLRKGDANGDEGGFIVQFEDTRPAGPYRVG